MNIHQLQVSYDRAEDRLRLRLSTTGGDEFRVFLTRRFLRALWPQLQHAVEAAVAVKAPAEDSRREVLAFEREKALAESDFSKPFVEPSVAAPRRFPLGETPILATRGGLRMVTPGTYRLVLEPVSGPGVDIGLDNRLMHSICGLIANSMREADWNLPFPEVRGTQQPAENAPTAPRVLN